MPTRIQKGLLPGYQEEQPQAQDADCLDQSMDDARALSFQGILMGSTCPNGAIVKKTVRRNLENR